MINRSFFKIMSILQDVGGSFFNNMIEYDAKYKKTDILHMQKNMSG